MGVGRGVRQGLATNPRLASNSYLSSHLRLLGTSRELELQLSRTVTSWFSFTCDLNDCFSKMTKKKKKKMRFLVEEDLKQIPL